LVHDKANFLCGDRLCLPVGLVSAQDAKISVDMIGVGALLPAMSIGSQRMATTAGMAIAKFAATPANGPSLLSKQSVKSLQIRGISDYCPATHHCIGRFRSTIMILAGMKMPSSKP
jgi:hypothetical protein